MIWVYNDGGRLAAGFRGRAGDCVTRAIAIATGKPYREVYDALFDGIRDFAASSRSRAAKRAGRGYGRKGSSPRNGVNKRVYAAYLASLGWVWTPTMTIGSGCRVHLCADELPAGRLVVRLAKHLTAVVDGVIHDTFDSGAETCCFEPDTGRDLRPGEQRNHNGIYRVVRRCVYGYWSGPCT